MWIWVLLAFVTGGIFGVMLAALCMANTASSGKKWWEEDDDDE